MKGLSQIIHEGLRSVLRDLLVLKHKAGSPAWMVSFVQGLPYYYFSRAEITIVKIQVGDKVLPQSQWYRGVPARLEEGCSNQQGNHETITRGRAGPDTEAGKEQSNSTL